MCYRSSGSLSDTATALKRGYSNAIVVRPVTEYAQTYGGSASVDLLSACLGRKSTTQNRR